MSDVHGTDAQKRINAIFEQMFNAAASAGNPDGAFTRWTALSLVSKELTRQNYKWSRSDGVWKNKPNTKLAILAEEFGEVARAVNEADWQNLDEELIQVAAVCIAWYMSNASKQKSEVFPPELVTPPFNHGDYPGCEELRAAIIKERDTGQPSPEALAQLVEAAKQTVEREERASLESAQSLDDLEIEWSSPEAVMGVKRELEQSIQAKQQATKELQAERDALERDALRLSPRERQDLLERRKLSEMTANKIMNIIAHPGMFPNEAERVEGKSSEMAQEFTKALRDWDKNAARNWVENYFSRNA